MNSIFVWTLSDVIGVVLLAFILVLFLFAWALNAFAVWKKNKKRAVIAAYKEKNNANNNT